MRGVSLGTSMRWIVITSRRRQHKRLLTNAWKCTRASEARKRRERQREARRRNKRSSAVVANPKWTKAPSAGPQWGEGSVEHSYCLFACSLVGMLSQQIRAGNKKLRSRRNNRFGGWRSDDETETSSRRTNRKTRMAKRTKAYSTIMLCHVLVFLLLAPLSFSFLLPFERHKRVRFLREKAAETETKYASRTDRFNHQWNTMFERLKEYKEEQGDCLVPQKYKADPQLGIWVATQRRLSALDGEIKQQRRDKLDSIGFVWKLRERNISSKWEQQWNDKLERLKAYKKEHGDCLVPRCFESDPQLGQWVQRQRKVHASGKLRQDREEKLNSIGFAWIAGETFTEKGKKWEAMFERLQSYKEKHGDCLVPQSYSEDPQLGRWVQNQRLQIGKLDSTSKNQLESIGFVWNQLEDQWETMFERLKCYKEEHGDCLVPHFYSEDPQLGGWVHTQRRGCSDLKRREKLESVGFVWRAKVK